MPTFDVHGARRAGYRDPEILDYLGGGADVSTLPGTDEEKIQLLRQRTGKSMLPVEYAPGQQPMAGMTPAPTVRRNMTPEEQRALWSEQGIEPTLPPFGASAGKLAADYLSIPVQQFLSELSGGVPSLLAVARWKKANLPQNLRQLVESVRLAPKTDPISQRATVFHATDPQSIAPILKAGEIVPDPQRLSERGLQSWDQFARLKNLDKDAPVPRSVLEQAVQIARDKGIDQATIGDAIYYTNPTASGHDFGRFLRRIFPGD